MTVGIRLQRPIHDKSIYITQARVQEGEGQPSDIIEAEALPKFHRTFVRADNEIKLHRLEAARTRAFQRMLAHLPRHPSAGRLDGCGIAAIGNMTPAAKLICTQIIGADDVAVVL